MAKKSKAKETKLPKDGTYIVVRDYGVGVLEYFTSMGTNGACICHGTEELEYAICGAAEEIGGEFEELDYNDCPIVICSVENRPEYIKSTLEKYHIVMEKIMAKKSKAKETKLPKDGTYIVVRDYGVGVLEYFTSMGTNGACICHGTEELEYAICGAAEEIGGEFEELDYNDCPIVICSVENRPEYIKSTLEKYHSDIESKEKIELARLKKKYEKNENK